MRWMYGFTCILMLFANGCGMPDIARMQQQSNLMQQLMKEPDLPAWYEERQKVTQALGDRVFDKSFDEVFDAITIGLGTLEVSVTNMEKTSGFIAATGRLLHPNIAKQLRHKRLVQYCRYHGYSPSLLENKKGDYIDPDMMGSMEKMMTQLTISVVKQGAKQTKVKLRFKGIYYPEVLTKHYEAVWPAIDKQIFLDKSLD